MKKLMYQVLILGIIMQPHFVFAQSDGYLKSGTSFYEKGDYDRAIAEFTKAIQRMPNSADVFLARGLAYWAQGNEDDSNIDFKKAVQLNPKYAEIFYDLPHPGIYTKEINKNPNDAKSYLSRGISYALKHGVTHNKLDFDRALSDYNKALELDPKNEMAYLNRDSLLKVNKQ